MLPTHEQNKLAQKDHCSNCKSLLKQPRTIDQQRADEILDWGEKGLVKISYSMIGDEPMTLAKQLAETLLARGWQIVSVEPVIPVARKTGIKYRHTVTL